MVILFSLLEEAQTCKNSVQTLQSNQHIPVQIIQFNTIKVVHYTYNHHAYC